MRTGTENTLNNSFLLAIYGALTLDKVEIGLKFPLVRSFTHLILREEQSGEGPLGPLSSSKTLCVEIMH